MIPLENRLPLDRDKIKSGGEDLQDYFQTLIDTLQKQYEMVAQAINGDIRNNIDQSSRAFIPTASGSTTAGIGTYTRQVAWVLRQGLMVDFWFDLIWTAHTGTGVLQIDLPYQCIKSSGTPFVNTVSGQSFTFSGHVTGIVLSASRSLRIQDNRSGTTIVNISVPAGPTTIRGQIRYIGVETEK